MGRRRLDMQEAYNEYIGKVNTQYQKMKRLGYDTSGVQTISKKDFGFRLDTKIATLKNKARTKHLSVGVYSSKKAINSLVTETTSFVNFSNARGFAKILNDLAKDGKIDLSNFRAKSIAAQTSGKGTKITINDVLYTELTAEQQKYIHTVARELYHNLRAQGFSVADAADYVSQHIYGSL